MLLKFYDFLLIVLWIEIKKFKNTSFKSYLCGIIVFVLSIGGKYKRCWYSLIYRSKLPIEIAKTSVMSVIVT